MGCPEAGANNLGLNFLAQLGALATSVISLLITLVRRSAGLPENLFVGKNLFVYEVRCSSPNVVDHRTETWNRRHIDGHGSLLDSGRMSEYCRDVERSDTTTNGIGRVSYTFLTPNSSRR